MLHTYIRTLLMYLLLVGGIRLLGKRQVGQMAPSEFVVTMMAANLATVPIENPDTTPVLGAISILTVFGAELVLSFLPMKSLRLRRLLCGQPVILVENGRPVEKNLRRTRVTLDELTGMLRQNNILDPASVRYAILETGGSLSVFPFAGDRPATAAEAGIRGEEPELPVHLISDGRVIRENLPRAGKERQWLQKLLESRGLEARDVLLLTVDSGDRIRLIPREEKP